MRMAEELNAEQVENFTLIPVGGVPDRDYGSDLRFVAAEARLQSQAQLASVTIKMVNHLKSRFRGIPIHRRHIREVAIALLGFQELADCDNAIRGNDQRQLPPVMLCVDN